IVGSLRKLGGSHPSSSRIQASRTQPSNLFPRGRLFHCSLRSRVEKKLAHLARRIACDGTLARPCECLFNIGSFQNPETANVFLGLGVWPIGDEHRTISLLPHRLCVAGRGNSASELPHSGSNHFAVERVDLLDHRFGYGERVEVVGEVVSN